MVVTLTRVIVPFIVHCSLCSSAYAPTFFKLRWSSGLTRTTRSRSFLTTAFLWDMYESEIDCSLTSVSLSTAVCAFDVFPAR
jgi:hypothetical protein